MSAQTNIVQTTLPQKTTTVLVTGGEGHIGSHTALALADAGYKVVIVDKVIRHTWNNPNIVVIKSDFANKKKLTRLFKKYSIDTVMHFAASPYLLESQYKIPKIIIITM
jgi:UDP-glucose 4-epimerase